jgi:hypothetical protein
MTFVLATTSVNILGLAQFHTEWVLWVSFGV